MKSWKLYQELTVRIAQLAGRDDEQAQESLKLQLMRRAELLNKAGNKIVEFSKLIEESDHIEHPCLTALLARSMMYNGCSIRRVITK